jgi:hypothetical protein
MGDVYRADDLTLDQPVALKFLPQAAGEDADRRSGAVHWLARDARCRGTVLLLQCVTITA